MLLECVSNPENKAKPSSLFLTLSLSLSYSLSLVHTCKIATLLHLSPTAPHQDRQTCLSPSRNSHSPKYTQPAISSTPSTVAWKVQDGSTEEILREALRKYYDNLHQCQRVSIRTLPRAKILNPLLLDVVYGFRVQGSGFRVSCSWIRQPDPHGLSLLLRRNSTRTSRWQ